MSVATSETPPPSDRRAETHPRTLVLCDLTESTALFERLGDRTTTDLIQRHDALARAAMEFHGGREIDKTDGFLVLFERPIQAVAFALEYQRGLRLLAEETGHPLNARVGIHFGEVILWENVRAAVAKGAKPLEVEGVAKLVAARLMGLACPGQILLSDAALAMARRAELEAGLPKKLRWVAHGHYHFKGLADSFAVHEVGELGVAPLQPPSSSTKAWPERAWWHRPAMLRSAGILSVVAAFVAVYVATDGESALAFGDRDWVVIGDFVNVNGDEKLNGTLNTAFRIGIEQSRFVNVVPDVSVRQTLSRMQRDSATRIDRAIGSEIALREKARAVILPSIAQYGSRVRLTAELIDPNDARTVLTRTSDADKLNDILPAMDRLLRETRQGLGESLRQIQATSQPLEQVATPNLEALRVLSRALDMERLGELDQAVRLLQHAIELDPEFGTAHRSLGSVLVEQERYAEGRVALQKALETEGRLTERERLFTRAFLSEFDDPLSALSQWRAFGSLYPDNGTGQNNAGNIYYMLLHDYVSAESELTKAAIPRNPFKNWTLQMLGHTLLAQEKLAAAEQRFRSALDFSPAPILFGLSDALVAQRKFDSAARYLDETKQVPPEADVEREMRRATLLLAQEKVALATAAVETAIAKATRLPSPNGRWRGQAALIALRSAQKEQAIARDLAAAQLVELSAEVRRGANLTVIEEILYIASWAARLGLVTEASEALSLALAQPHYAADRFPVRAALFAISQAEIDLQAGRVDAVLAAFPAPKDGDLWEVHELRARAFRLTGDRTAEVVELSWLVDHRGLAYGQWTDQLLGQQARVLMINDAQTRLVDYSKRR